MKELTKDDYKEIREWLSNEGNQQCWYAQKHIEELKLNKGRPPTEEEAQRYLNYIMTKKEL